jgi:signal transduction histidine kinase
MEKTKRLTVSPVALGLGAVVLALSVVAFFLARDQNQQQNRLLLHDETTEAAQSAASSFSGLSSDLSSLAQVTQLTNASTTVFNQQIAGYSGTPLRVALAHRQGNSFTVLAGNGFATGASLPKSTLATLNKVGGGVTPTPVLRRGHSSTVGLAIGYPAVPQGDVIYMQFSIDPFNSIPATEGKPFALLEVALYGSAPSEPSSLVVANTRSLPLTGQVASATVAVGTGKWTLVAVARHPLIGTLADFTPWITLGRGVLAALLIGAIVEVMARRRRYAEDLVAERTAELVTSQEALVRSERLSAVGEMTTVIGHELRNPLAAVTNSQFLVGQALQKGDVETAGRYLTMAERETARAAALAEDLTAYMRQRPPEPVPIEIDRVVDEVLEATPPPPSVRVEKDMAPFTVEVDDRQIHQILDNLLSNAYQALPDGGRVRVEAHCEGDVAVVSVEDTGAGFSDEQLHRVFEPFFTTKVDGTGLGLAIVRRLAEGHHGSAEAENYPGGGRVVVRLPVRTNGGT